MQDLNLAVSCMELYTALLATPRDDPEAWAAMPDTAANAQLTALLAFAVVWSVGGNTNDAGRAQFERYFRTIAAGEVPPDLKPFVTASAQKVAVMPEA